MSDASIKSTVNARLPAPPMLLQGSAQAGANLSLAASAWMVSGITASPLLNTLLPALGALPFLLHLKRTARGYWLQIVGVLILLGVSLALKPMGEHKTLCCSAASLLCCCSRSARKSRFFPCSNN